MKPYDLKLAAWYDRLRLADRHREAERERERLFQINYWRNQERREGKNNS